MRYQHGENLIKALRCPVCKQSMQLCEASLVCEGQKRHCYDFAASGYVNLSSPTQSGGGDSKAAIRARSEFLNLGYYQRVAEELAEVCQKHSPTGGMLVDAGCGEGYYCSYLSSAGFDVFGADLSKFGADAASKRLNADGAQHFLFAVASVFELPLSDGCADVITNVFAPCAELEYKRVLKNGGILCVAHAGPKHLWGLKEALYDTARENTERADLPNNMMLVDTRRVEYSVTIEGEQQIKALFAMTPYYWRTSVSDMQKLDGKTSLTTQIDIIISVYKNTADGDSI